MRVHEIVDPDRDQNQDEDENEVDASQSARGMQAHFKAPSEAVFQIVPIPSPVEYFFFLCDFLRNTSLGNTVNHSSWVTVVTNDY